MIVALRAADGQSEQGRGHDLDRVRHDLVAHRVWIGKGRGGGAVGAHAQEAGGDKQLALLGVGERVLGVGLGCARQFVAGELFGDKLVERFVGIKGTDDLVAILV